MGSEVCTMWRNVWRVVCHVSGMFVQPVDCEGDGGVCVKLRESAFLVCMLSFVCSLAVACEHWRLLRTPTVIGYVEYSIGLVV